MRGGLKIRRVFCPSENEKYKRDLPKNATNFTILSAIARREYTYFSRFYCPRHMCLVASYVAK